jgi:YHS domain-containing protein
MAVGAIAMSVSTIIVAANAQLLRGLTLRHASAADAQAIPQSRLKEAPMTQAPRTAIDPVCGMTVEIEHAKVAGLTAEHDGTTYYFCGRGCKLDFEEERGKHLEPGYTPTM